MKKIIHITDLHVGVPSCSAAIEDVVARIVGQCDPAEHVVVVTGDMVDNAKKTDAVAAAWGTTLAPLRNNGFVLVVTPGNHDFGGGAAIYPEYAEAFYQIVGPKEWPDLIVVRDGGITFIGIDSQTERMRWSFGLPEEDGSIHSDELVESDGLVGWVSKAQRMALPGIIGKARASGDKVVVHLHHDPLSNRISMGLGNRQMVQPILAGHIDGLLCGHTHQWLSHAGEWRIPHFYNGGSTGGKDLADPSPVRIIDLDAPQGAFTLLS
jgi:3',5'-cyclic AMP phosphodiesterase CpdA